MRLTKQQFIDRFKPEEMVALLAAAKMSVAVEAWLFRFNSLTPDADGTTVDLTDPRTVAGLQALEMGGLISPGRAIEMLSANVSSPGGLDEHEGIARGASVRVLAPFDTSFPEPLIVESIQQSEDGSIIFILQEAGAFSAVYLEPLQ